MKRHFLIKLAEKVINGNELETKKSLLIAKTLKREDLKLFIKYLKVSNALRSIKVSLPNQEGLSEVKNSLARIYPGKKIVITIDPTLLTGIRVEDYDNVYELSLKNFLEQAVKRVKYD